MPTPRKEIYIDQKTKTIRGRFYEIQEPGMLVPRFVLCKIEEALYKRTSRGLVKRSEKEYNQFVDDCYNQKLVELLKEKKEKASIPKSPPVREVMQLWLDNVAKNRSKLTVQEYLRAVNEYVYCAGNHSIHEFKKHFIYKMQDAFEKRHLSVASQKKNIGAIQTFLNWAYDSEYLEKPVKLDKPRPTKREPLVYSTEDLSAIKECIFLKIETAKNAQQAKFRKTDLRAFIMMTQTIMRRAEVFYLQLKNISLKDRMILLREVPEKNWTIKNKKEAAIPISEALAAFLEEDLRGRDSEEVWFLDDGKGELIYHHQNQLSRSFGRYCKELGFAGIKPVHGIRATGITRLLEAGASIERVKKLARHADISTTLSYFNSKKIDSKELVDMLPSNI